MPGPEQSVRPIGVTSSTVVTPLTVIVATREGARTLETLLAVLTPQLRSTGADAVVVCGSGEPAPGDWTGP